MAASSPRDPDGQDGPGFDWLYGGRGSGDQDGEPDRQRPHRERQRDRDWGPDPARDPAGASPRGTAPRDPEPTRMLPTLDRPSPRGANGTRGSEHGARGSGGPYQAPPPSARARPRRGPAGPGGPGSARPVAPPPSRRPGRRRPSWLRWVVALLAVWLVFLVVVPILAWQRIDKVAATPEGERPGRQGGTTYLLVGSDSRQGLTAAQKRRLGTGNADGQRTDTIMLLHTGSGPNLLMSIPRDSMVQVPGYGTTKINAAYARGGPRLLVRTIEANTGIRVDEYVQIGFAGFVDVVDAVGGVGICPEQAMKDPRANLDIPEGCQEADGRTALGYARSRHTLGLGDIGRAQHQREVVSAVGAKAASPWTIVNPVRYYRLAMAGSDSVAVGEDTGLLASMRFAFAMTRVNGKNGLTCSVPIRDLAVNWDPERSRRLFRLIAEDRTDDVPRRLCRANGLPAG